MTPPWGSLTVPATEPVVICAEAGTADAHRANRAIASIVGRLLAIIDSSSCSPYLNAAMPRGRPSSRDPTTPGAREVSPGSHIVKRLARRYTRVLGAVAPRARKSCEET